ncbi:hypothetical protein H5P28_00245 [Ruficoccus amylovorans]|uniref:Uncharacterized protein n=1 Tax=Ruficoccus amylovorans TaxID=1804625 RepID=A0A842HB70_9BACT|nr:hypothetical protein [Ruficoccus amylovorans]MBC2592681.1 hypothetical protein [Ruficoccus amylovorans]
MSTVQKAADGFSKVVTRVFFFFVVLFIVCAVGVKLDEKKTIAEGKAKAEARAKAIADAGPYGLPPKTEWGEVPAVRKWIDQHTYDARTTDWWGPHKVAYVKNGENILCWRVSVAYVARRENGEFYGMRRLFYLRQNKIIGTELAD